MTDQFTPGPWRLRRAFHEGEKEVFHPNKNLKLPLVPTELAVVNFGRKEGRANARLIAAAPDLLEALRLVLAEFCKDGKGGEFQYGEHPAVDKARAAIRAATGAPK